MSSLNRKSYYNNNNNKLIRNQLLQYRLLKRNLHLNRDINNILTLSNKNEDLHFYN